MVRSLVGKLKKNLVDNTPLVLGLFNIAPPLRDCAETPMLTELLSNTLRPLGTAKRTRICEDSTTEGPETATPPTQGTTPLVAAMACARTFVRTLHPGLQTLVEDLIGGILKDASKFHYKSEKLNEMRSHHAYIPRICWNVGMVLQCLSEVQKTAGFKSLQDDLLLETQALRRAIGPHGMCSLSEN